MRIQRLRLALQQPLSFSARSQFPAGSGPHASWAGANPWIPRWLKQGDQGGWKDLRIWGLETYVLRIKQLPWIDVGGIHREEAFYPLVKHGWLENPQFTLMMFPIQTIWNVSVYKYLWVISQPAMFGFRRARRVY